MKFSLLSLLFASATFGAPVNDSFASRISLGNAAAASAAGNNAGATLQTDENDLDAIGGASVWWKWTAPRNTWVTVDTAGSAIDTVLAVLTDGPSLDDAYVVGCNDESGDPGNAPGISRVVFQATAGTEYHIAVHGFLGVEGDVAVNVRAGVTPSFNLAAVSLAPASVNVTDASQTITAEFRIVSESPFAEGALVVHHAGFSGITEVPLLPASLVSGTASDGVYRVSIPVPRYVSPGTWMLEIALSDIRGQEAVFGRGVSAQFEYDHVLPDGIPGLFPVSNAGAVDDVAPALPAFSRTPAATNVTLGPAALNFAFRVTDALSGFGSATLTLYTPAGEALAALPVSAAHRTTGTSFDGTYALPFSLPAKMPGGTWSASLLLRDAAGNPALFDGAINGEDFPLGPASGEIAVTGSRHSYWAWMYPRLSSAQNAQPNADWDGDGTNNLLEFAFGLGVDENDGSGAQLLPNNEFSGLPAFSSTASGLVVSFVRRRSPLSGLTYSAEFSSSLDSWLAGTGGAAIPVNDSFERVTAVDPDSSGTTRFARIRVTLAE